MWSEVQRAAYDQERKDDDRISEWKERFARNRGPLCAHNPPQEDCRVCRWERMAKMEQALMQQGSRALAAGGLAMASIDRLAFEPHNLEELKTTAELLYGSKMLPAHIKSPQALIMQIIYGREQGMSLGQSVFDLYVIPRPDGTPSKPAMWTENMIARVRVSSACEYLTCVESTNESCTWETKRTDSPKPSRQTFTIEDAARAKLTSKAVWQSYPKRMLMWRAAADLIKMEYQDVTSGIALREEVDDEQVIDLRRAPGLEEYSAPAAAPPPPADPLKAKLQAAAAAAPAPMRNVTPPRAEGGVVASGGAAPISPALSVLAESRAANPPPEPEPPSTAPASTEQVVAQEPATPAPKPAPAPDDEAALVELEQRRSALWAEALQACDGNTMLRKAQWDKLGRFKKNVASYLSFNRRAEELIERLRIVRQIAETKQRLNAVCGGPVEASAALKGRIDLADLDRLQDLSLEQAKTLLTTMVTVVDERESEPPEIDAIDDDDTDGAKAEPGADG